MRSLWDAAYRAYSAAARRKRLRLRPRYVSAFAEMCHAQCALRTQPHCTACRSCPACQPCSSAWSGAAVCHTMPRPILASWTAVLQTLAAVGHESLPCSTPSLDSAVFEYAGARARECVFDGLRPSARRGPQRVPGKLGGRRGELGD